MTNHVYFFKFGWKTNITYIKWTPSIIDSEIISLIFYKGIRKGQAIIK